MLFIDPTPLVKWNLHVPCRLNFFLKKKTQVFKVFFSLFLLKRFTIQENSLYKDIGSGRKYKSLFLRTDNT